MTPGRCGTQTQCRNRRAIKRTEHIEQSRRKEREDAARDEIAFSILFP
jgi:hypothetical protein